VQRDYIPNYFDSYYFIQRQQYGLSAGARAQLEEVLPGADDPFLTKQELLDALPGDEWNAGYLGGVSFEAYRGTGEERRSAFVPAEEARAVGLIGHVVADGKALDAARGIADQIAANGPVAVQAVLKSLRATREMPETLGLAYELEVGQPVFLTEDAQEGPRAFAEKRAPNFVGR